MKGGGGRGRGRPVLKGSGGSLGGPGQSNQ